MDKTFAHIQIRRDTEERWERLNPELLEGEWGFELDTGKAKIGIGKEWNDTDYFGGEDYALKEGLAAEKDDRIQGDIALQKQIALIWEHLENLPDPDIDLSQYATIEQLEGEVENRINADTLLQKQIAELREQFIKVLENLDGIDGEQIEILVNGVVTLDQFNDLLEKLEREIAYRIEGDADLEAGQERQDDEIERIELESKARDLALELEILYLAKHGQACNVSRSRTIAPNGPPFVSSQDFNVNGNVVHITEPTLWDMSPNVGDTLRFSGANIPDGWSSVITDIGERYQPPSGWYCHDITVEDIVPPAIADILVGAIFDIASCPPSGFVKTEGDTMTGDLIVNAEVHADVVETLVVDSGENSNLLLKHDGNTKVYVGSSQVTIQNPLKLNTEGTDDEHAVTKKYIDDKADAFVLDQQRQDDELAAEIQARAKRDLLHDAQIDTIEYKLETLVGLTFRGAYEFKHDQDCEEEYQECISNCTAGDARCESDCVRAYSECEQNNVEPGFFEAIDPDGKFDNLQEIIISKNDKSNVEIDWAGVLDKDDYLEVDHVFQGQHDKTNYGLYRIMEEPEAKTNGKGEVVYTMKLQFLQGDGVLNEKELYEIRGITAAEGVNPEELGDFLTKTDAAATYLPLIGGKLTGSLEISGGKGIKFTGLRDSNKAIEMGRNTAEFPALLTLNHPTGSTLGGYDIKLLGNTTYNELRIMGGSNADTPSVVVKANGFTTIYKNLNLDNNKIIKLADPTDDTDAATKRYVDAAAGSTVSLNCGSGAKWRKGTLGTSTLEGYRYFGIEVAESSSSSAVGNGNVLYLDKLVDSEGVLQEMKNYTPTDNSYCEVYYGNELLFKGQLKPSTYKVAGRNPDHIVCDFSTKYPLVAKGGTNWSTSLTYNLILTGMKRNG